MAYDSFNFILQLFIFNWEFTPIIVFTFLFLPQLYRDVLYCTVLYCTVPYCTDYFLYCIRGWESTKKTSANGSYRPRYWRWQQGWSWWRGIMDRRYWGCGWLSECFGSYKRSTYVLWIESIFSFYFCINFFVFYSFLNSIFFLFFLFVLEISCNMTISRDKHMTSHVHRNSFRIPLGQDLYTAQGTLWRDYRWSTYLLHWIYNCLTACLTLSLIDWLNN